MIDNLKLPGQREGNIIIDFNEEGINTRNWVDFAQDRDYWCTLVNMALKLRVPYAMVLVTSSDLCGDVCAVLQHELSF